MSRSILECLYILYTIVFIIIHVLTIASVIIDFVSFHLTLNLPFSLYMFCDDVTIDIKLLFLHYIVSNSIICQHRMTVKIQ